MPFCPLPEIFREDVQRLGRRGVLELGSGDGSFTALLRELGAEPLTLDRRSGRPGARAAVRGDALQPPLRGSFGIVVAANLLRQLWPLAQVDGLRVWCDLVAPQGCLWIFEDEPLPQPAPARNYRDLQAFLARLLPAERRPLLAGAEFRRSRAAWRWPGVWRDGASVNEWPLSAPAVIAMLTAGRPRPQGEAARLIAGIQRDGVACGRCWWSRWQRQEE